MSPNRIKLNGLVTSMVHGSETYEFIGPRATTPTRLMKTLQAKTHGKMTAYEIDRNNCLKMAQLKATGTGELGL